MVLEKVEMVVSLTMFEMSVVKSSVLLISLESLLFGLFLKKTFVCLHWSEYPSGQETSHPIIHSTWRKMFVDLIYSEVCPIMTQKAYHVYFSLRLFLCVI